MSMRIRQLEQITNTPEPAFLKSYIYKTTNVIIFMNGVYDMRIGKFICFDTDIKYESGGIINMYIIDDLCLIVVYDIKIERIANRKCCIYRFSDRLINVFPTYNIGDNYKYIDNMNIKVLYMTCSRGHGIIPMFAKWNKYYVSLNFKNQIIIFNEKFDIVRLLTHDVKVFNDYPDTTNPLFLGLNNIIIDSELNITNMENISFTTWISEECFIGSQDDKIYIYKIKNNVIKLVDETIKECSMCMTDIKNIKIALVPCGHTDICQECSNKIKTCPICKVEIEKVINIF